MNEELMTQYIPTFLSQVRFKDRGYIPERVRAQYFGLIKGRPYLVDKVDRHPFHANVYLIEIPGIAFNLAMFDMIQEDI